MRFLAHLFIVLVLFSCSEPASVRNREGAGGKHYGGIFNANEVEDLPSLFPLSLTQAASHRIGAQVYEGLVRLDQEDLTVRPCLADSWTVDASLGTVYTFALHQGVRFHDDTCFADGIGRELTAKDVVDCFTALCTYQPDEPDVLVVPG